MSAPEWKDKPDAPGWWFTYGNHPKPIGERWDIECYSERTLSEFEPDETPLRYFGPIPEDPCDCGLRAKL